MKSWLVNINAIFCALAIVLSCGGCKTTEERKKDKEASMLRFHLETNPDGSARSSPIAIFRQHPMPVNLMAAPFLTERDLASAEVVEVGEDSGFAIKVVFDRHGTLVLESYTASYKGQRMGIFASWTEPRWLAAPRITQKIANGTFIFTPDASREEAERICNGLRNLIKKAKKRAAFD